MKYAKLEDGYIRYVPKQVQWKGHTVNNPSAEKLLELGYLPVQYTDMPQDAPEGQHYESGWKQAETAIVQTWHLAENPVYPEPEPTMRELMLAIERGLKT